MSFGFGFGFPKNYVSAAFSPSSLFAAGEQGAWYDPSDRSTLFQDSAGTTPVTAVEQSVGLMLDKSKGLVLGPELVVNGEFSENADGWSPVTATLDVSNGRCRLTNTSGVSAGYLEQYITTVVGKTYQFNFAATNGTTIAYVDVRSPSILYSGNSARGIFTASATSTRVLLRNAAAGVGLYSDFDRISVRELPGNHAFQTTSTSRPVLSARYNLLTKTEQFDDVVWSKSNATVTPNAAVAPDGTMTADAITPNASNAAHDARQTVTPTPSNSNSLTFSVYAKANGYNWVRVQISGITPNANPLVYFNIATGEVGTSVGNSGIVTGASISSVGNGWYLCSVTATVQSNFLSLQAILLVANSDNLATFAGDGTSGIYIWGADLRVANDGVNLPPYQRVNTATDYDTNGFPLYLRCDGVDDGMVTNSIDFTATDKMTVVAGVRKLSDAALGVVAELSPTVVSNPGAFYLVARASAVGYQWASKGTSAVTVNGAAPAAPTTNVLTGLGDISGDSAVLRVDGTQANSTADQGSGNFGNYPLYLFRRGGTINPFNGRFYGIVVRGAQSTDAQIQSLESWVNQRTRAY